MHNTTPTKITFDLPLQFSVLPNPLYKMLGKPFGFVHTALLAVNIRWHWHAFVLKCHYTLKLCNPQNLASLTSFYPRGCILLQIGMLHSLLLKIFLANAKLRCIPFSKWRTNHNQSHIYVGMLAWRLQWSSSSAYVIDRCLRQNQWTIHWHTFKPTTSSGSAIQCCDCGSQ